MIFNSEPEFEVYVRGLITKHITKMHSHIYSLNSKKVADIVLCNDGDNPSIKFIEIKYFKLKHGRLGIGSGKGKGFQPEILDRGPKYFDNSLLWCLGREGDDKFYIVDTPVLRKYLAGGGTGEKYNNIQLKIFNEIPGLTEPELICSLIKWLVN